jgi:dihydrofolate reductase
VEVIIIAAMAANRVIGRDGAIPWHLPEELQWFKATTMGHVLIMGRKTHESIGRPLPGRTTFVISRSPGRIPGCTVAQSLEQALKQCAERDSDKVFIAGGAEIYAQALPLADTIILTVLDQEFDGDTLFPLVSSQEFVESRRESILGTIPFTRVTLQRKTVAAPPRASAEINCSVLRRIFGHIRGMERGA